MNEHGVRWLRPARVTLVGSELWVFDVFQPVAAVLDPGTGALLRTVSWPELPPRAVADEEQQDPRVCHDGRDVWVQNRGGGPLLRIGHEGDRLGVWTDGLKLMACGPDGAAWCAPGQPDPSRHALRRVDRQGAVRTSLTELPVRWVQSEPDGLYVKVGAEPDDGRTDWLRLAWDAELPAELTIARHGVAEGAEPVRGSYAWRNYWRHWHQTPDLTDPDASGTEHHVWAVGWSQHRPDPEGRWRGLVATVHSTTGAVVRRWGLGEGSVLDTAPLGSRLVVSVSRRTWGLDEPDAPGTVVALDPATDELTTLLAGDSVDISGLGWPLCEKPLDAEAYTQQVQQDHARPGSDTDGSGGTPLVPGMSDFSNELVGAWPDTVLEWTFRWAPVDGIRLRRRHRLFDELGRIAHPGDIDVYLMEDLETQPLPPLDTARDGFLDF